MLGSRCQLLSFDGINWKAKEIKYPSTSEDSLRFSKPFLNFQNILDSLEENNVFTLPNQQSLNLNHIVYDGISYFLIYKIYDKFRCYQFSNPKSNLEMNESVPELKNYYNITKIFNSIFNR